MTVLVVVNADDMGIVTEVNAAIEAAHQAGSVTSATMFARASASEHAAEVARRLVSLDVGLHFDLTHGAPALDAARVPTLVGPGGRFLSRAALLARALRGGVRASEVRSELEAQLAALEALGVTPTHLDGHQHVQVIPTVAAAVRSVARARQMPIRVPSVRWRAGGLRRAIRRVPLAALCALSRIRGATYEFASVFDYGPPRHLDADLYARIVRETRGTTLELMVHPARPSTELERLQPDSYPVAVAEGRALADPAVAAALRAAGTLVTFAGLRD